MSLAAKITLGAAIGVSSAIIGYVHYKQSDDRLKLHQGVIRDVEQQQRRKHENTYALQQQIDITKQLKSMQPDSDVNANNSDDTSKTKRLDSIVLQPPP